MIYLYPYTNKRLFSSASAQYFAVFVNQLGFILSMSFFSIVAGFGIKISSVPCIYETVVNLTGCFKFKYGSRY